MARWTGPSTNGSRQSQECLEQSLWAAKAPISNWPGVTEVADAARRDANGVWASHLTGIPLNANMFITAAQSAVVAIENEVGTVAARHYVRKDGAVTSKSEPTSTAATVTGGYCRLDCFRLRTSS
jgi:hypothetical protein